MAVEKMRLVDITGLISNIDMVVRQCIINKEFHPENAMTVLKDVKGLTPFEHLNPYTDVLKLSVSLSDSYDIPLSYSDFNGLELSPQYCGEYLSQLKSRLDGLREDIIEERKLAADNRQVLGQLKHLENLNARLDDLFNFTYAKFRYGRIPRETYDVYSKHIENDVNVIFIPSSIEREYIYGMYVAPVQHAAPADALFASLHFERIRISDRAHGTPAEATLHLNAEIDELLLSADNKEKEIVEILAAENEKFLKIASYLKYGNDAYEVRQYAVCSETSFFLYGWVPESSIADFCKQLDGIADVLYSANKPDANNTDLPPPTKLKNNFIARPFEFFIKMYGLPAYNEIDPTFFMSITYVILYGMMFGDVGQGILFIIFGLLLRLSPKFKKNALVGILPFLGVTSTIFGFVYGSLFGNEEIMTEISHKLTGSSAHFGLDPLNNTTNLMLVLVASIGIGVLLISLAMIINILNGIKQKNFEKALFSSKGVAGFVFYWSIVIGALIILLNGTPAKEVFSLPFILGLIILPLFFVFAAHPLGKLLKRKDDWMPKKKGDFIMTNIFELLEVVISFLSNTISFIRIGALALNHAGMMLVFFILGHLVGNIGNSVILVIGNLFVMLLEGFIVGIQVLRLEFYEMFSKFYAGTGKPYKNLTIHFDKQIKK